MAFERFIRLRYLFHRIVGGMLFVVFLMVLVKELRSYWRYEKGTNSEPYRQKQSANLICYYNIPNDVHNDLQPTEIDPFLCTHINVAFAAIQSNHTIYLNDNQIEVLNAVVGYKKLNKNLKVFLSVGGAGASGFRSMIEQHSSRKRFIHSAFEYASLYAIDGIDLDWEFPTAQYSVKFIQLLEEFRQANNKRNRHKVLMSLAVPAQTIYVDAAYRVNYINTYADMVNLMSYDYHFYSEFTPFTGLNSPLHNSSEEAFYLATLNINFSASYWVSKGIDKRKLNVGLPTYGHTFKLVNENNDGLYAPASGYGDVGHVGFATLNAICSFTKIKNVKHTFERSSASPYASYGYEWISYENEESVILKAQYIRKFGYGGAMIYSLNADDYNASCGMGGAFPLIRKVRSVLLDDYA